MLFGIPGNVRVQNQSKKAFNVRCTLYEVPKPQDFHLYQLAFVLFLEPSIRERFFEFSECVHRTSDIVHKKGRLILSDGRPCVSPDVRKIYCCRVSSLYETLSITVSKILRLPIDSVIEP